MIDWRPECTKQSWGTSAGEFTGGPTKIVLHSTETVGFPSYESGTMAPHETWKWDPAIFRFEKRQHVPHTLASRALKNVDGGVQTNRDGAHQVELVGYSDERIAKEVGGRYLPGQGDAYLRELGREVRKLAQDIGLTNLTLATPWVHYPDSWGVNAGQRFSPSKWDGFAGICGHEHVPENDHGDPGDLDVARALSLSDPEDDMPLTDAEIDKVAQKAAAAVWGGMTKLLRTEGMTDTEERFVDAFGRLFRNQDWQNDQLRPLLARFDALEAKVDAITAPTGTGPLSGTWTTGGTP